MRKKIFYLFLIFAVSFFVTSFAKEPLSLSLRDAILLAVRTNPNVMEAELNHVQQKFNLHVQEWQFEPHYAFQASTTLGRSVVSGTRNSNHNFSAQPGVSLLTPMGTQLSLTANNTVTNHYHPGLSLQVMQPLMRGFGKAIVETALYNALDSEKVSRLNIEGTLRNTVTAVINAYLDVVSAERTIKIDTDAVKRAELSVEETRLYIKAGHKAGNELVTVRANVASAKMQLENDKNNLKQARFALLSAIGVDPNTDLRFSSLNIGELIDKYHSLPLDFTKNLVLENDIQYQVDQITLHGSTSRSLLVAEDNTRWQLNLSATETVGNGGGGGLNAGINSLSNLANQSSNVTLSLQIPIDDQLAKQAVLNAKIAREDAELALKQEKWNKETGAINGWNNVVSAERALKFAYDAEKLQEKTYELSYQKYLHGLIDSLELQSAQLQLIQSQQSLLSNRIIYLKALVNLDLLIGNTLKTWDVQVR